jgi:pimeloyl-ACP methyl ester carboxylesterase
MKSVTRVRFAKNAAGQRIAYVEEGVGPCIVLPAWWVSHLELDGDEPEYGRFFRRLASRFRVVRYDRIGVGLSDRVRRAFTFESEISDLAALIDHLGVTKCHLVGFSCGGPIALGYAVDHPDRVDRIALYASFLCGEFLGPKDTQSALVALVRADGRIGSRTLADLFCPTFDAEARRRFNQLQRASAEPDTAARLLELTYALDARPFVDRVRGPVLVLHRKDDRAIRCDQGRTLAASLPNATMTTLPGSSHMPWHDDGDAIIDSLFDFFGVPGGARSSPAAQDGAELRREGEAWHLAFEGRSALLRDSKGVSDLARLLGHAGEDVHVLDLLGADALERRDVKRGEAALDTKAMAQYRRRLAEIEEEIGEAEARSDLGRSNALTAEREAILESLSADTALRGRSRRLNDPVERARKAVSARLRDAIRHVKSVHPSAGEHLERSIRTGVQCAYRPAERIEWTVVPDRA